MKLKYEVFIELNSRLIDYFYKNFKPLKWHSFNLLAIAVQLYNCREWRQ